MQNPFHRIRFADSERDSCRIAEIFAPYAESSEINFEDKAPSPDEIARRIDQYAGQDGLPFLVCEQQLKVAGAADHAHCKRDNHYGWEVLGYAYASPFRLKPAYRFTVELSIYFDQTAHSRGLGRQLYSTLMDILSAQGYRTVVAVTSTVSAQTVGFHYGTGFEMSGIWKNVGFKNSSWLHRCMFTMDLWKRPKNPLFNCQLRERPLRVQELDKEVVWKILRIRQNNNTDSIRVALDSKL